MEKKAASLTPENHDRHALLIDEGTERGIPTDNFAIQDPRLGLLAAEMQVAQNDLEMHLIGTQVHRAQWSIPLTRPQHLHRPSNHPATSQSPAVLTTPRPRSNLNVIDGDGIVSNILFRPRNKVKSDDGMHISSL